MTERRGRRGEGGQAVPLVLVRALSLRPGRGSCGEGGQAVPLVLAVVALAVVVLLALAPLGRRADERARAQAAADAAALAGAAEGEDAAREVAEANGAELIDWWAAGTDVWVQVEVGDTEALAQARRE